MGGPTPTPLPGPGTTPEPGSTPTPSPNGPGQTFEASECPRPVEFGEVDSLALALENAGLTPDAFGYSEADYDASSYRDRLFDPFLLSDFRAFHDDVRRTHCYGRLLAEIADHAADSADTSSTLVARVAHRLDRGFAWGLKPRYRLEDAGLSAIGSAISQMQVRLGMEPLSEVRLTAIAQDAEAVPKDFQLAVVPLILAVGESAALVQEAFAGLTVAERANLYQAGPELLFAKELGQGSEVALPDVETFVDGADWQPKLYEAAWVLAAAVDAARTRLRPFADATGFSFEYETPIGWIIIRDGGIQQALPDDPVAGGNIALYLDTGGSDEYRIPVGANRGPEHPVSLHIDLGGNDFYGYPEVGHALDGERLPSDEGGRMQPQPGGPRPNGPISLSQVNRQGAGRMGVGILADFGESSDTYRSLRMSQGFGVFGAGLLFDDGGNDRYEAEANAQGAAMVGMGLLYDAGGDDDYRVYHFAQGAGGVRGAGWLIDNAGNDVYLANIGDPDEGGDPLYFSSQRPGNGNLSCVQGAGFGVRGDGIQRWWSGGIGLLRDRRGDDRYAASVFAQGMGFWSGTGVLADGGGSDEYDGISYVQGAAAHYATGVLLDAGPGNDIHNDRGGAVGVALGSGHDFGVGVFVAGGGSDAYKSSELGMGSGNCNGTGLFVDLAGNDRYNSASPDAMGYARLSSECSGGDNPRRGVATKGIFIDMGGVDEYIRPEGSEPALADDSDWVQRSDADGELPEHGGGLDIANAASSVEPEAP